MNLAGFLSGIKKLRFRTEFLGWFLFSVCLFILSHIGFIMAPLVMGGTVSYVLILIFGLSIMAVGLAAYSGTRMIWPLEQPSKMEINSYVSLGLIALTVIFIILLNVLVHFLNYSIDSVQYLALVPVLGFYLVAMYLGHHSGRLNNALETQRRPVWEEPQSLLLVDLLRGRSKRKFWTVSGLYVFIGVLLGSLVSSEIGNGWFTLVAGLYVFFRYLYPIPEERREA